MDEKPLLAIFGLLVRHFRVEQVWSVEEAAVAVVPLFVNFAQRGESAASLAGLERVLDGLVEAKLLGKLGELYEFTYEARDLVVQMRRMLG